MEDRATTVRSRALGRQLRAAMGTKKMSGQDVARITGWSGSKVSRLLSGKRGGEPLDVVTMLTLFGVFGPQRDEILASCTELAWPGMVEQHGARLPQQLATLIEHEDLAHLFHDFQPTIITGLLQTEDYARALLTDTGTLPEAEIEGRVTARMERRSVFERRKPPTFEFFVHESALRLPVGGREVMSGQLNHLLEMAVRNNVSLRVVPIGIGAHAGIAGAFKLMEFPEFSPVVYVDSETVSIFLETAEEVGAYRNVLRGLAAQSLNQRESVELIATLANRLYD